MAYEDLLKDSSESFEDGNYFIVTISDLDPNATYPLQFRWKYKDGSSGKDWSAVKIYTTPGESAPNTPGFLESDVDVSEPEKIIITYRGLSDDETPVAIEDIDRVDIYINGAPFDGSKPTDNFKEPGTKVIPAPAGTYTIVLYAISKLGTKSPVSEPVTKTVTSIGVPIDPPTLPTGLSVATAPFAVTVNWNGSYSTSTFSGFKSIDVYAVSSDLGSSVTSGITATNLVGSLTVNDTTNRINIGLDNLRQALGLSSNSDVYNATIFYYYNATNLNNEKFGAPTYTRINSSSIVPTKANFIDLASGVISIENLVAGNGQFSSWLRTGSAGGARIELSAVSDFTNGGNTVQKGLVAYSSGNTEIFNLDIDAGTLAINGSGTFTGNLTIGSVDSVFKAEPATGIWLGNSAYASAPFRVSNNGNLYAITGTVGGWTLGSTFFQGNNIKLDTGQIIIGSTASSYFDMTPSSITHRNSNGTASGKFTLTLGASPQLTIDGTLTINGSSVATQSQLDGYATDTELSNGLSGKISTGGAANDVNSNTTTISGGKIRTGQISSTGYSYSSGNFSTVGMEINLDNGRIRAPQFAIDSSGNAYFKGTVEVSSGTKTATISPSSATLSLVDTSTGFLTGGAVLIQSGSEFASLGATGLTIGAGSIFSNKVGGSYPTDALVIATTGPEIHIGASLGSSPIYFNSRVNNVLNSISTGAYTTDEASTLSGAFIGPSGVVTARRSAATPMFAHRTDGNGRVITFYLAGSGGGGINATAGGTPTFASASDYRLKEDIVDYINATDRIKAARLRKFKLKAIPDKEFVGFIAHEFAEVDPEFVIGEKDAVDENGDPIYQEIGTTNMIYYLTGALKESIIRIEELEQRLDALEG